MLLLFAKLLDAQAYVAPDRDHWILQSTQAPRGGQTSFDCPPPSRFKRKGAPQGTVAGRGDQTCWAVRLTFTLSLVIHVGSLQTDDRGLVERQWSRKVRRAGSDPGILYRVPLSTLSQSM